MPRPKRYRMMGHPPAVKGFKPFGGNNIKSESINLLYEEYEAIKLSDYQNLSQLESSKIMNISRPTFTRIYERARKKIATAFIENRTISIDGGNVKFEDEWYNCTNCKTTFKSSKVLNQKTVCPLCKSSNIIHINPNVRNEQSSGISLTKSQQKTRSSGFCTCPECGMKISHKQGVPCKNMFCPECNSNMIRE